MRGYIIIQWVKAPKDATLSWQTESKYTVIKRESIVVRPSLFRTGTRIDTSVFTRIVRLLVEADEWSTK